MAKYQWVIVLKVLKDDIEIVTQELSALPFENYCSFVN